MTYIFLLFQLRPTPNEAVKGAGNGHGKKKPTPPSPYVVLRQKSVHEMHNLVLELDNNLSLGSSTRASSSNSGILFIVQGDAYVLGEDF